MLAAPSGQTYYVDCLAGSDAQTGTSPESAWQTLDKVNTTSFTPGDTILLKRGTVCKGLLWPKGSGAAGAPISLGAYGSGSLPVIDGGAHQAAVRLFNQEYWHLRDLEITGGTTYGVLIGAQLDRRALRHFRLTNLVVHDVWGGPVQTKASGLVVFAPEGDHPVFDDILIDGVTAYNTNQWGGIIVNGGNWPIDMDNPAFGSGIIVRNSTVYNVYGDGIALWYVQDGLIEHCVAFDTGQQPPPQTIGTPNAIWTWACLNCTVQFNEAYRAASPEVDAGCFDIDWATQNNVIQYNYGHDSDGYCLAVFGAEGITTVNAIVRYNVCQNNARRADMALRQGDMFLSTWNGGALDGVQIYNNIFFWNPAQQAPLLKNTATFRGNRPAFFRHNRIYSMVSPLLDTNDSLECDHNLYWVADTGPTLTSALAGSDARAPLHLLGSDGAEQTVLVGFVNALADGSTRDLSRSQIVFLKSMARQYESIRVILVDTSGSDTQTLAQAAQGWQLPLLPDEEGAIRAGFGITQPPATVLIGPDGGLIHRWDRFVAAQTLAFALQGIVGLPRFST